MNLDRRNVGRGILWCGLMLVLSVAFFRMRSSQIRFQEARRQLQQCEQLVGDIQTLQTQPGFAALRVDSPRTITARAEGAVKKASISPTSLARIEPQSAVRLRDSDYRLRLTRLQLNQVTLKQALAFTHAMIDEAQGTTVRDLRLTAANGQETDAWSVELVLTQLIYSPSVR